MEETNPASAKTASREAIIASLKEIERSTEGLRPHHPRCLLIALDREKQEMIAGDRVKVYDQVEAQIVIVTKTEDLILDIDRQWYLCLAGNVRLERKISKSTE